MFATHVHITAHNKFIANVASTVSSASGHGYGPAGGRGSATGGAIVIKNASVVIGAGAMFRGNSAVRITHTPRSLERHAS